MVVVRDPAGRVLVHRRAATKLTAPSMHDMMIGGVVGAGESYDACAAREVEEEIGAKDVPLRRAFAFRLDAEEVDAPPDLLVPSQWITVYETTWDGPVVPQESEIDWWDWLDEVELERRVEAGEPAFCPDSVVAWRRLREPPRSRSTDGEPGPRS
jgi:8-oxo-dGTP pyrophosphatase MutT (NUDIX family)